jgi:toxin HigB-1
LGDRIVRGQRHRGYFDGRPSKSARKACPSDLLRLARRKLDLLKGEREGQYSIRINDQWRVCFQWTEMGAGDVEIVDYH